jgi:hypothetical protein
MPVTISVPNFDAHRLDAFFLGDFGGSCAAALRALVIHGFASRRRETRAITPHGYDL